MTIPTIPKVIAAGIVLSPRKFPPIMMAAIKHIEMPNTSNTFRLLTVIDLVYVNLNYILIQNEG